MSKSIILTFHTSIEFCTLSKFHASIANACTMRLNHSSSEHHVGSVISGLPPSQKSISSFWVICVVWQGNFSKAALKIPGCCGHLLLFPAHAIETDWIVLYPGCLAWLDAVQKNANMHKYLCLFYLVPRTWTWTWLPALFRQISHGAIFIKCTKNPDAAPCDLSPRRSASKNSKTDEIYKYLTFVLLYSTLSYFSRIQWDVKKDKEIKISNRRQKLSERCEGCWADYWFLVVCHAALACCETSTDLFFLHDILCSTTCNNMQYEVNGLTNKGR